MLRKASVPEFLLQQLLNFPDFGNVFCFVLFFSPRSPVVFFRGEENQGKLFRE